MKMNLAHNCQKKQRPRKRKDLKIFQAQDKASIAGVERSREREYDVSLEKLAADIQSLVDEI